MGKCSLDAKDVETGGMAPQIGRRQKQKWQSYYDSSCLGTGKIRTAATVGFSRKGLLAYPDMSRLGCKKSEAPVQGVQDNKRNLASGWEK